MCQNSGNPGPHIHAHGGKQCCSHMTLDVDEEIRKLEEEKRNLQEIICRIDVKINHLNHVRP